MAHTRTGTQPGPPLRRMAGSHMSKKEASIPSQGLPQHLKYILPIGITRRQPPNSHPCLAPAHYNTQTTTIQARKAPHHQAVYEVYHWRSVHKEGLFPPQHAPIPPHPPSLHLSPQSGSGRAEKACFGHAAPRGGGRSALSQQKEASQDHTFKPDNLYMTHMG